MDSQVKQANKRKSSTEDTQKDGQELWGELIDDHKENGEWRAEIISQPKSCG